jgi:signal transduction histidine kinase
MSGYRSARRFDPEFSMLIQLSIKQRFQWLLAFSLACFALCGTLVYHTLAEVRVGGPIYERIVRSQDLVADILPPPEYLLEAYLLTLQMDLAVDEVRVRELASRLRQTRVDYEQRYHYWQAAGLDGALATLFLEQSHALVLAFHATAQEALVPALLRADHAAAAPALRQLGLLYERQRAVLMQVVVLARQRKLAEEATARARMDVTVVTLMLAFGLTAIVFILICNTVGRSIAAPLHDLIRTARKIAGGDWGQRLRVGANNEANELMTAIRDIVKSVQVELVKSEKMAALGALVAGISHELNTPLGNGLMAVSTLHGDVTRFRRELAGGLRKSTLNEFVTSAETATDIALRNLERAAALIDSFKQVAADRTSSQRRRFQLDKVVAETLMSLHPLLKQAPCEVVSGIPAAIVLDSFPGPLGQVLSNMIENAVRHAFRDGRDGARITLRARLVDGGTLVAISVADNGIGMAPAIQERVFEPFFTTRLGQGGSGLGMHISHNIVYQILGGRLTLASVEGEGSVFEITVPLVAPDGVAAS